MVQMKEGRRLVIIPNPNQLGFKKLSCECHTKGNCAYDIPFNHFTVYIKLNSINSSHHSSSICLFIWTRMKNFTLEFRHHTFTITLMQAMPKEGVGCHPLVKNYIAKSIKFSIYVRNICVILFWLSRAMSSTFSCLFSGTIVVLKRASLKFVAEVQNVISILFLGAWGFGAIRDTRGFLGGPPSDLE